MVMMTGYLELVVIIGFIYYLFNGRLATCASTMIDVIAARVNDACAGLRQRPWAEDVAPGGDAGAPRLTDTALRRATFQQKRRHMADREQTKILKENSLYQIKEVPSKIAIPPMKKPFLGLSCDRCTPNSRSSLVNKVSRNTNVINLLHLGYQDAEERGLFCRTFCDISRACSAKKFDYKHIFETVLNDERFKQVLQQITQDSLDKQKSEKKSNGVGGKSSKAIKAPPDSKTIYKAQEKRARSILVTMRSTISDFLLKLTSWTCYKLLPYFVTSVNISPNQIEVLQRAGESGLPLIFMPLHRSHLDYILVSFVLANYNIRCPLVAAGDNLKIPFFGWLLRGLGAFYIKRRLENSREEKDTVYRAALHTYMMHCLRARHNIEFFIEGGRSRTGKPQLPKGGILSVIVDAYLDGTIEDALLVPVSMNYEKLVDGNFVREQLGMPKQMETFGAAIKAIWKVLNSHYGSIRVDFNQPFSMRELVRSFNQFSNKAALTRSISFESPVYKSEAENLSPITIQMLSYERTMSSNPSCASLYGGDCITDEQQGLVEAIGRHIVYDSMQATSIMSTNAVAFLLLTRFRHGCSLDQLVVALEALTNDLLNSDKDVGYTGEAVDVANHAINILGPGLVLKEFEAENIMVKPVSILPNIIELSYYSNCLLSHYTMSSIAATALQVLTGDSVEENGMYVSWQDLTEMSLQLCEILSQEFILCKPCQTLEDVVGEAIHSMCYKEWLVTRKNENYTDDQISSIRFSYAVYGGEEPTASPSNFTLYSVNQNPAIVKERQYMQTVLRPLIDVYSITTQCLPRLLVSENGVPASTKESEFVQDILAEMKVMLDNGDCKYGEALSTDGVKNCLRLLRMWGVVDLQTEGRTRLLQIAKAYRNPDKLRNIHDLISRFKTTTPMEESISKVNR